MYSCPCLNVTILVTESKDKYTENEITVHKSIRQLSAKIRRGDDYKLICLNCNTGVYCEDVESGMITFSRDLEYGEEHIESIRQQRSDYSQAFKLIIFSTIQKSRSNAPSPLQASREASDYLLSIFNRYKTREQEDMEERIRKYDLLQKAALARLQSKALQEKKTLLTLLASLNQPSVPLAPPTTAQTQINQDGAVPADNYGHTANVLDTTLTADDDDFTHGTTDEAQGARGGITTDSGVSESRSSTDPNPPLPRTKQKSRKVRNASSTLKKPRSLAASQPNDEGEFDFADVCGGGGGGGGPDTDSDDANFADEDDSPTTESTEERSDSMRANHFRSGAGGGGANDSSFLYSTSVPVNIPTSGPAAAMIRGGGRSSRIAAAAQAVRTKHAAALALNSRRRRGQELTSNEDSLPEGETGSDTDEMEHRRPSAENMAVSMHQMRLSIQTHDEDIFERPRPRLNTLF